MEKQKTILQEDPFTEQLLEDLEDNDELISKLKEEEDNINKRFKNRKSQVINRAIIRLNILYDFDFVAINLASPDQISKWAKRILPNGEVIGEVLVADTFNYRTFKPESNGLFCERIFGPLKSWECQCKQYVSIKAPQKVCERCSVELTESRVRRHRMGFIDLVSPVAHIWYLKGLPSYLSIILERPVHEIEEIVYFKSASEDTDDDISTFENLIKELEDDFLVHEKVFLLVEDFEKRGDSKSNLSESKGKKGNKNSENSRANSFLQSETKLKNLFELSQRKKKLKGAEGIKDILDNKINIETEIFHERQKLHQNLKISKARLEKSARRLRILESFYFTKTKLSWMILTNLPVLPPDLRPMLEMDGGKLVSSDLNELYRTVINRNNRLYEMLEIVAAPDIVINNEKLLLQEAVDALIDNDKLNEKAFLINDRPLRSLSELIEGKQGRFRQNLLGKRVDYSARSVIVVGPNLRLNQCGLPFEIVTELFQPYLIEVLTRLKIAKTVKMARDMIKQQNIITLKLLELFLPNRSVLLNRAPTLHRLGVQAFDPIVVPGQAIQLHPLVCSAFNADFDGDQMAVHLPISSVAQLEVKRIIRTPYNFLASSNGLPIIKPSQDIIIGCYYLTLENENSNHLSLGNYFSSFNEVILAYYQKKLSLHTPIWVRLKLDTLEIKDLMENKTKFNSEFITSNRIRYYNQQLQFLYDTNEKVILSQFIRITPGRILFNHLLERNLEMNKKSHKLLTKLLLTQMFPHSKGL